MLDQDDILDVLACEIGVRPDAPTFEDLAGLITGIEIDGRRLSIGFEDGATEAVRALAGAESICCKDLDWEVEDAPRLRLIVTGTENQAAALAETVTFLKAEARR